MLAYARFSADRSRVLVVPGQLLPGRPPPLARAAAGRGPWREVVNTDAVEYGGSGVGNLGGVDALDEPLHGRPFSAGVTLPPLAAVWLVPES